MFVEGMCQMTQAFKGDTHLNFDRFRRNTERVGHVAVGKLLFAYHPENHPAAGGQRLYSLGQSVVHIVPDSGLLGVGSVRRGHVRGIVKRQQGRGFPTVVIQAVVSNGRQQIRTDVFYLCQGPASVP